MMQNNLNPKQKEAVESVGGPILIFAGAGSGKTRVLTHKIAFLIKECGLNPENVLAVTFTNKAADEMKQRVQKLLNIDVSSMSVGTFHSISARLLRREIQQIGYSNDFIIYDQADSRALVKQVIRDLQLDEKTFVPKAVQSHISKYKNQMISPELLENMAEGFFDEKLCAIYKAYQTAIKENNALDFDDLLLKPLELFKEYPGRLDYYQQRYRYVLVDEYQDTNKPQFELVYSLSVKHRDICVVGDDDQSIYGWRGADVENILKFTDAFTDAKVIKLEQNYRSTKTILDCAWTVVSKNTNRAEKKLWTENSQGDKISILEAFDERDEARILLNTIQQSVDVNEVDFDDMVILYRTNAQSRVVEDVLRREGVPYQIVGGVKFYDRKEIKDVLAYLRLIINPSDGISFDRIVNFPARGVGNTTTEKIHSIAKAKKCSYLQILEDINKISVGKKQKKSLKEFYSLISKFQNEYKGENAVSIARDLLLDIGLQNYYENQNTQEAIERWENVEELINSIAEFGENRKEAGLQEFLEEVSLLTDIDRWNKSDKAVTLMTIHSAKGLEFPIVMIAGLEEGLFPLGNSSETMDEMEEERRLFYVALTRAKKRVYLTFANARRRFGGAAMPTLQSRFLYELPENLIEAKRSRTAPRRQWTERPKHSMQVPMKSPDKQIQKGDYIQHKMFGKGLILAIEGVGDTAKITIQFSGNVRKKFIAKYANLKALPATPF